jgi:hypothetical protein
MVAKAAAPLETPSIYGSASSFFTSVCIDVPLKASEQPTQKPSSTLGSLTVRMILSCVGVQSGTILLFIPGILLMIILQTSAGETLAGPIPIQITILIRDSTARTIIRVFVCILRDIWFLASGFAGRHHQSETTGRQPYMYMKKFIALYL